MRRTGVVAAAAAIAVIVPWFAGCEGATRSGGHEMTAQGPGHEMGCKMCYEEAVSVTRQHSKGSQWTSNQIIKKHACPECKTDMTVYTQDGKPMLKCAKCAPEGIACDKCRPPAKGP